MLGQAPDKSAGKPAVSDKASAPDKSGGPDKAGTAAASGKSARTRPEWRMPPGRTPPSRPPRPRTRPSRPRLRRRPRPRRLRLSGSSGRRYSGRASRKDTLTRAGVAARAAAADGASGTAAVRRRLARLGTARSSGMNPVLEPLIKTVRLTHPKADIRPLERAYETAARLHKGQDRKSGDPYITHPLAVATILAELGMNTETLAAALLHDTIEDTDYTLGQLRADFGDDIAALVDGVTKLDKVKYGDAAQAETVRKMVVAMSRDIRVLVIKLADRLHNMRTLRYLPRPKQEQKSREVLEIFAPLAHRLGMNTVKWELEDLAFATLYPKRYDEIARLVSERSPRREMFLQEVSEDVTTDLREAKIKAMVTGRPKHYYSVYQKMIARNVGFDDIYDLVGIRVLVDSLRDCYAALGIIHARWNPVPGRFKDYIAMPKFNMYQSLHTTVIGPEGKPVELQIRTWGMHRRAEYGVAAHWKYKEEMTSAAGTGPPTWPGCASWSTGSGRPPTRPSSSTRSGSTWARPRSTCSPRAARSSRCPRGPRRSTSPTRSTPRSGTGPSGPGSTAAWCRWRARSTTATRSRSSRPRPPTPGPAATGSASSRAPGRGTRSGTGSPRSAGRRPPRPARRPSPGPCASRACRCSGWPRPTRST